MPTDSEIYGYGTLANIICCLCSLGGAVILPCATKHRGAYNVIMPIFMGLAIGTLLSDAALHLVPEAFGLHSHGGHSDEHADHAENDTHNDHSEEESDEFHVEPYALYGMIILAGCYLFYILEIIMISAQGKSGHSHSALDAIGNGIGEEQKTDTFHRMEESNGSAVEISKKETKEKNDGIKPIAIMIIVGDAIHNFADGLAVAASFNKSILEGVSITIAIVCHEIPHELGDFAVLLQNGFSFWRALLANLFSSLTALIGFYVGVTISKGDESNSQWIFAITAGLFFYISLADMVPQIIHSGAGRPKTIVYHNIGMLIGALIIILLSLFEDKINI